MRREGKTVNHTDPYARRGWRGYTFDNRTISAYEWAEKRYLRRGWKRRPIRFGQGSFSHSDLSAGTHAGGGAGDVMFVGVPNRHRKAWSKWARKAGFAEWPRLFPQWELDNEHSHSVLLGHRTASEAAQNQMASFKNGRDGLIGNLLDKFWRPRRPRRWSHRQNKPILLKRV